MRHSQLSKILWDEESQRWYVKFLQGECAGQPATYGHAFRFEVGAEDGFHILGFPVGEPEEWLLFEEYADAVAAEILLIQSARVAGLGRLVADDAA